MCQCSVLPSPHAISGENDGEGSDVKNRNGTEGGFVLRCRSQQSIPASEKQVTKATRPQLTSKFRSWKFLQGTAARSSELVEKQSQRPLFPVGLV